MSYAIPSTQLRRGRTPSPLSGSATANPLLLSERVTALCFAYILWLPVSHGAILYSAVALMALSSAFTILRRRLTPPLWMVWIWLLLATATSLGALIGSFNDNPGLLQQCVQWFGSLLAWGLFSASFNPRLAKTLVRTLVVVVCLCSAMMLLYIAQQRGFPTVLPSGITNAQGAGVADPSSITQSTDVGKIRWYGLSTLTAGAPFLLAGFILGPDEWMPRRMLTGWSAALSSLTALLAGRRAILLVVVLTPLIVLALKWRQQRKESHLHSAPSSRRSAGSQQKSGLTAALLGLPLAFLAIDQTIGIGPIKKVFTAATTTFLGIGGDPATLSTDDLVRTAQTHAMLGEWSKSPLFGRGLGAIVPGFSRSDDRPWMFELQYHQMLLDEGIVGLLLLALAGFLLLQELHRVLTRTAHIPSSTVAAAAAGAIALALANASDPYLQAIGHGWGWAILPGILLAVDRGSKPSRDRDSIAPPAP